jgi:hypothetical protein
VSLRIRVTTRRPDGKLASVAGARVRLAGVTVRTNGRGRTVLRKRRGFSGARRYRLRVTRSGYQPALANVRVLRRR